MSQKLWEIVRYSNINSKGDGNKNSHCRPIVEGIPQLGSCYAVHWHIGSFEETSGLRVPLTTGSRPDTIANWDRVQCCITRSTDFKNEFQATDSCNVCILLKINYNA